MYNGYAVEEEGAQ